MNNTKAQQAIINGKYTMCRDEGNEEGRHYDELYRKVEGAMSNLEEEVIFPEGLSEKLILLGEELEYRKPRRISMSSIIQIAAAVAFGVFIGHKFGKNADVELFKERKTEIDQYIEAHYLNLGEINRTLP